MTLTLSAAHRVARLNATLAFLAAGSAPARLRIYAGVRGELSTPLVEIPLQTPPGEIVGETLVLTPTADALVMQSGEATWACLINGEETLVLECDVSDPTGAGEVTLPTTTLYAGGTSRLVSAVLG